MKTVLFIEDNTEIRENMAEILELAGYKVLLALDGKEGVSVALSQRPDIIICDIMMPELDGYGVIHLLQKHPETQHIPFIFLTAKAERTELRKGMELGADDYITKPFSGTELLNAIEGRLKKAAHLHAELQAAKAGGQEGAGKNIKEVFQENQDTTSYQKKQVIYSEGQHAFRLYQVQQGRVKVYKTNENGKDLILSICQPGDFFGYTALLEGIPYRETAETLEAAEINSITREVLEQALHNSSDAALQVIQLLAGNILEKEEQLIGLAYNSLRKKVAEALLLLQAKYGRDAARPIAMKISRDNLASIAGTAKESLIRTLGDFRDEGLIQISGSEVTVVEADKLRRLIN